MSRSAGQYLSSSRCIRLIVSIMIIYAFITNIRDYLFVSLYSFQNNNNDQNPESKSTKELLNPLFVTITTIGYVAFTKNWILYMKKSKISDYLIVCYDIDCQQELSGFMQNYGINNSHQIELVDDFVEKDHKSQLMDKHFLRFGSDTYKKFIHSRPNVYKSIFMRYNDDINSKYNAILFMDSDMVIVPNRFDNNTNLIQLLQNKYLLDKNNRMYDMVFVGDHENIHCNDTWKISGGLIFIPFLREIGSKDDYHRQKILYFMDAWSEYVNRDDYNMGDQPGLNHIYHFVAPEYKYPFNMGRFNCKYFPTGALMKIEEFRKLNWDDPIHRNVKIVHANFNLGHQNKVDWLIQLGLWQLKRREYLQYLHHTRERFEALQFCDTC